ncbi:MAG: alginate export family protein [Porticoccus sp.]
MGKKSNIIIRYWRLLCRPSSVALGIIGSFIRSRLMTRLIYSPLIILALFPASLLHAENAHNPSATPDTEIQTPEESPSNSQFPSHIPRARWSEDWSRLRREGSNENGDLLPFKHVELDVDSNNYLSFGGEYRFTYERYDDQARGLSDIGKQDVLLHRFAGHADWYLSKNWRIFTQLGFAKAEGREGGHKAGDESDLNVWQFFVDKRITLDAKDERIDIRVGRQFIEKYNWLVGAGEARNIRQYYDGVRVAWLEKGFAKVDVYAAEFVDADEDSFSMEGTDEYFWGANTELLYDDFNVNLLYLGWDLKDLQFEHGGGGRHDEKRHTAILRLYRPATLQRQFVFDSYLIYQFGDYDDAKNSDIKAFATFGEIKYALHSQIKTPMIGIKAGYFSGDDDPDDNTLKTFFDPIFVTPYFSYARDVMPYNLIHLQPNVGYRFSSKLQATLSNDFLWRAEKSDAFYTGASAIGINASDSDDSYIGSQQQLSINWVASRQVVISSHLVHFDAGDVVEDGGGENQWYAHFGFSFMF